jgi:hypothetical protein
MYTEIIYSRKGRSFPQDILVALHGLMPSAKSTLIFRVLLLAVYPLVLLAVDLGIFRTIVYIRHGGAHGLTLHRCSDVTKSFDTDY